MSVPKRADSEAIIVSDASGNWRCGAYSFLEQSQSPESRTAICITIKELIPIIMSCTLWETIGRGTPSSMYVCGNAAVIATINANRSKDNQTMHLHTCNKMLNFFLSHHDIINSVNLHHKNAQDHLSFCHIPSDNIIIIILLLFQIFDTVHHLYVSHDITEA